MMHDGIRADGMSALYATTAADRQAYAVDEVAEHTTELVANFDAAAADGANTTRQSAERVGVAAAEIEGLIGQFSY